MRTLRYVVADVFTDTPLAGNPVAVFTDGRELASEEMQGLARELNLSESVFVLPAESGGHARIRIFTPGVELPFAGHPTLGTAFVLAQPLQLDEIRLETVNPRRRRLFGFLDFGWQNAHVDYELHLPTLTHARLETCNGKVLATGFGKVFVGK